MPDKVNNLQDMFLNSLRRTKTPVTMFLVKGVKLQGIITWFDNFSVLLRRDGQAQLIYKHAISTIMPSQPVDLGNLQEAFDEQLAQSEDVDLMFRVREAGLKLAIIREVTLLYRIRPGSLTQADVDERSALAALRRSIARRRHAGSGLELPPFSSLLDP